MKTILNASTAWGHNAKDPRGFTLIELMIVVMVIAILASVAIPQFLKYKTKAMQIEAITLMRNIRDYEITFYSSTDKYTTTLSFDTATDTAFYKLWNVITWPPGLENNYMVTCSANLDTDAFRDRWDMSSDTNDPDNIISDIEF